MANISLQIYFDKFTPVLSIVSSDKNVKTFIVPLWVGKTGRKRGIRALKIELGNNLAYCALHFVQRAAHAHYIAPGNMRIDHGGLQAFMT